HAPFLFDDGNTITENDSIKQLGPAVLSPPLRSCSAGRPLVNLSLAVNYFFGGLEPWGYHLFNMAVHALSAMLLWAIVRRPLRLEFFDGRFDRAAEPLALLVALVWAVHPLQTETVQYVTQRTEGMVGCCYLATLYACLLYWTSPRETRGKW